MRYKDASLIRKRKCSLRTSAYLAYNEFDGRERYIGIGQANMAVENVGKLE